jgi:hypothetical protein
MIGSNSDAGDAPIQVIEGLDGKFLTHFWDESTHTEAAMFYWPEGYGFNPVEERVWSAQWPMTADELKLLVNEWDFVPKFPLTDLHRRTVPTSAMNAKFLSTMTTHLLVEVEDLSLPSEKELDRIIELTDEGILSASQNPALSNRRDLRGRWKELRALQIYIQARVSEQDSKPARKVQQELGLENITSARNLIERARQHNYLSRSSDNDELEILPSAISDAASIRELWIQAREMDKQA